MKNERPLHAAFLYVGSSVFTPSLIGKVELQKETLFSPGPLVFFTLHMTAVIEYLVFKAQSQEF